MSNQGEEGWYPKCKVCSGANLGDDVVCEDCYKKSKIEIVKQIFKELEKHLYTAGHYDLELDKITYEEIKAKFLQEKR